MHEVWYAIKQRNQIKPNQTKPNPQPLFGKPWNPLFSYRQVVRQTDLEKENNLNSKLGGVGQATPTHKILFAIKPQYHQRHNMAAFLCFFLHFTLFKAIPLG